MEYRVLHACGHEQVHHFSGYASQQERKANWLRTTSCRSCFVAEKQAEALKTASVNLDAIAHLNLVSLVGSERQVQWAATLRASRLVSLGSSAGAAGLGEITDARWWIDYRDLTDEQLLAKIESIPVQVIPVS